MRLLWELFSSFFRIGLLIFGGGYAMLPMLEREVLQKRQWATQEELLDDFAISQAMPGIIAVNTAILVGHKKRGALGAVAAGFGVVLPSLVIIILIAALLRQFMHLPAVAHAFAGIRVAAGALIAAAVVRLLRAGVLPKRGAGRQPGSPLRYVLPPLLCAAAFVAVALLQVSPVWMVLGATVAGLLFFAKRGGAPD